MLEEHYHQVFEYELIVLADGFVHLKQLMRDQIPALVRPLVTPLIRRAFVKHLHERGIARHTPAEVEAMGRADVDRMLALLFPEHASLEPALGAA